MKKNLKSCMEQLYYSEPECFLDMNNYEMITASGMIPDLKHKKSAHMTAGWRFADQTSVRIALPQTDLSGHRYLTFSVYAIEGQGGSFHIRFESDATVGGEGGYGCTLPVCRNGWNDYRIELPFLQARKSVCGWDHITAVVLDCVVGGQYNRTETVLCLDNFYLWEELAPQLYIKMPELKGAAMFSKTAPYAIVNRKRLPIAPDLDPSARPFEANGVLWLPMAPVAAAIAFKAVVDNKSDTLSFTYRRKKYVFYGNSDRCLVGGEEQILSFRPMVRAGTLFFPADYLRSFFHWRQLFVDPTGVIVLSNRKNVFESGRDDAILWQLNAEMTFVQPSGEDILNDLHKKISNPDKGRLLLTPEEWMACRKLAKTDPERKTMLEKLKQAYGVSSAVFAAAPIFSDEAEAESGLADRIAEASDRIWSFSALFRLTGDKRYAERSAIEQEALASLSDWDAENSMRTAAVAGLAMAVGYDWCHTAWSEGRKAVLERAMLRYAMRPAVAAYNGKGRMWQIGTADAAEINCGMTALALALADVYPETSLRILRHSLRNAALGLQTYSPDGGYSESVSAWERGTRATVLLLSMLQSAVGKDYGLSRASGFAATAYFPIMTETANGAWNYHDSAEKPVNTAVLSWFSRRYGNPIYAWLRRQEILSDKKPIDVLDFVYDSEIDPSFSPELPLDAAYRKAGLAMLRSGWDSEATCFGIHGGSNHAYGSELDAGSILLEMGGERFLVETGGNEALPRLMRMRAQGQNTLVVNPPEDETLQDQNPDAIVPILAARSAPEQAYAVLDMASTNDAILRGKRGILLTGGRKIAVVQDELVFAAPAQVVWGAYTRAEVTYLGGRTLILEQNGKKLLCKLSGAGSARFAVEAIEATDLKRITVKAEAQERLRMAVAFKLFAEGDQRSEKLYDCKSMSSWEI